MRYYTADTHFGFERILEITGRPFKTIHEHDEYLLDKINRHVSKDDELWILGDFGNRPDEFRKRIICETVFLVWGNHDSYSLGEYHGFEEVYISCMLSEGDALIYCSHYPHAYWPQSHLGSYHIYGHTHDCREETLEAAFPNRRAIDVGVDTARRILGEYRPWAADELLPYLAQFSGHDNLRFYREEDARRKNWQVDSQNQLIYSEPTLDTRPALQSEYNSWLRNRGSYAGDKYCE